MQSLEQGQNSFCAQHTHASEPQVATKMTQDGVYLTSDFAS